MCKKGDIIIVKEYVHGETYLTGHPFVVLSDKAGKVLGFDFNMIALVMSSFKDDEQRQRKLQYPGNFPVSASAKTVSGMDNKDAFIKADQFYFFDRDKLDYQLIGSLTPETFNSLISFIMELSKRGVPIKRVVDNL